MDSHAKIRRVTLFAALAITAVIAVLHLEFRSVAGGLWRDEAMLVHYAQLDSARNLTHDSFPALMATVIHGWGKIFSTSDVSLRWLGALIGLGVIGALWASVWSARRSPPLVGLALLGLNSVVIIYGDSVRAYGLGSLLVVLLVGVMWWFLKNPSWRRTGILLSAALLAVQALFQNAVLFAGICGGAWVVCGRRKNFSAALKILGVGVVAAASLLPYWDNFFPKGNGTSAVRSVFCWPEVCGNLTVCLGAYACLWLVLAVAVVAIGVWSGRENQVTTSDEKDLPLFAGVTLLLGGAGFFWFLWFSALNTQIWHFPSLLAFAAVCFDLGLPYENKKLRVPWFGFALALALIAAPFAGRELHWRFTPVDLLAARLNAETAPEDLVLVTPWYVSTTFERYYRAPAPWDAVPPVRAAKLGTNQAPDFFFRVTEQMTNPAALRPQLAKISATLQAGHRVWVVGWLSLPEFGTPYPPDLPPAPLRATGWSDTPYTLHWNDQIANFLVQHSRELGRVSVPSPVALDWHENVELFRATGWRTNVDGKSF
ncbi:MAG: hypothetical protein RLZZ350_1280 [Verrucomicrobiota bacterium]|jgi:hypothetical protein